MCKNNILKILVVSILIFMFSISYTIVLAEDSIYVWSSNSNSLNTMETTSKENNAIETNVEPVKDNSLNLKSGAAILIEQNTGQVLYEHNIHEKLRPASVTKVMTLLLIMEALDDGRIKLEDKIACSENAAAMGGSQIWLDIREELTVDEMLKAICIVSANDCTVAMAEHLAGSEELFVQQMNEKAKSLGMNDTTFKNCHGIDEDGHVTSAYDISLMSRELMLKHPGITKYTTIWMDSLRDGKSQLVNTNKLIRTYSGATGLKTGSTSIALFNLSATATKDNLSLIAVIMKAESSAVRFAEAKKILDYGFSTYGYKEFAKKGESVSIVNVEKGVESTVNAIFENTAGSLVKKGQEKNVVQNIKIEEKIIAPIEKGQKIGEASYEIDGKIVGTVNIISDKNIDKIGVISKTLNIFTKWFNLVR